MRRRPAIKFFYFAGIALLFLTSCNEPSPFNSGLGGEWIDLSHDYGEDTLYWPTSDKFAKTVVSEGDTDGGYYYSAYNISTSEHGGTHLDAPVHFAKNGQTTDQIPLENLIGPGVVIDITSKTRLNRDYQATVQDLMEWESVHGKIDSGSMVLINTGSAKFWPDAEKYLGTTERGQAGVDNLHFPGVHPDAAQFLANERKIQAIGLDTPSIDYGQSTEFMTHRILFAKNILGFENVANLDKLPATGSKIIALPMKIRGGSGGPLRIIANIPKRKGK